MKTRRAVAVIGVLMAGLALDGFAQRGPAPAVPVVPAVSLEEAAKLEAVVTTNLGVIRFEFLTAKAPKHVQAFIKNVRGAYYDGSAFHRAVGRGIIQGGDPLLKDPKTPRSLWGTGGLSQLADEFSDVSHVRGIVSTVRIPGRPNSDGAQFFICISDQVQLNGQFSAFGRVTEGLDIAEKISLGAADSEQKLATPVKIISVKLEPKREEPFKNASKDALRKQVVLKTTLGTMTVAMDPDVAPEHVRNFLKLVQTGWYDHTIFHRIAPGFVAQGGTGQSRQIDGEAKGHYADQWVRTLKGEFTDTRKHTRGVLSMARADDPDSADTSFFIMLGPASNLDGKYTIFGNVVEGIETLEKFDKVALKDDKQTPVDRIEVIEAAIRP